MTHLHRGNALLGVLFLVLTAGGAQAAPSNDNLAHAKTLTAGPGLSGTLAGESNIGATAEFAEPTIGGAPARHSVWYRILSAYTSTVNFDVVDNLGLRMTLFRVSGEGGFESFQQVQSTTNALPGDTERLSATCALGYSLYLAVDSDTPGQFSLNYRFTQVADDFLADAETLPGASGTVYRSTTNATLEAGEPPTFPSAPSGTADTHTVWLKWTAPTTDNYTFDTIGSAFATTLEVYAGTTLGSLALQGSSFTGIGLPAGAARVNFKANAGITYAIRVYGQTSTSGSFTLNYYLSSSPGGIAIYRSTSNEVGAGSPYAFAVRRLMGSAGAASVKIATSPGSGNPVANQDYTPINQVLSFADGETEKQLSLVTFDSEPTLPLNFTVILGLSNPSGATLAPPPQETAVAIFLENPATSATPYLTFLQTSITATEGGYANIPFLRSGNPSVNVTESVMVIPATDSPRAKAGMDLSATYKVTLGIGQLEGTLSIPIPQDYLFEGPEDVTISLNGSGAVLHLVDDDTAHPEAAQYETIAMEYNGLGAFCLRATLSPSGAVTGQIRSHAGTFPFKGTMAPDGRVAALAHRPLGPDDLQISLQFTDGLRSMHGTLHTALGDVETDFDCHRALRAADGPSAQAGHYTFYCPSLFLGNSAANPLYGTLSIGATGKVQIIGKLVGGQTISIGGQQELGGSVYGSAVSGTNQFLSLYLAVAPQAGYQDFGGEVWLHKYPKATDKLNPDGFPLTSNYLQAIRCLPLTAGSYALSAWQPAGAGKMAITGGGLTALSLPFTATTQNTVQFASAASLPVLRLSPSAYSFSGSITPPGHAMVKFSGILYQGTGASSLAIGNFISGSLPGAVTLSGP